MDVLQNAIHAFCNNLPQLFLTKLIEEKLAAQKVKLSKKRVQELVAHILAQKSETIRFNLGKSRSTKNITIEFTDEDGERISRGHQKLLESFPKLIEDLEEKTSDSVMARLKARWPQEARQQLRDIASFRHRLYQRWESGLDALRMQVHLAREFNGGFHLGMRNGKSDTPISFDILLRLHARACQIADEIICLLSGGFADGAMARWRTMQEIAAVCFLVSEHGDELAERYRAHDIAETRRVVNQYVKYRQQLGEKLITDREIAEIEKRFKAALDRYGPDFKNQYGWASKHLNKANPTITDLQEGSKIDYLSPYYRMASHGVHANPKGIYFKLGLISAREILLTGPSNAGLADPGQAAALSLMQISTALLKLNPTFDNIVAVKIMSILSREIAEKFFAAHQKLLKDEKSYSKSRDDKRKSLRIKGRRIGQRSRT